MAKYQVIFFKEDNGSVPAKDFINSLDTKMVAKIYRLIAMITENGPELREPYSKHLKDGIFELRAQIGSDISRVLYFFFMGQRVVITNGFTKKTQKTPEAEIEKARNYRREWEAKWTKHLKKHSQNK
ncbi:MAG: type II toxin-antitoxin system RelE/ParE family toxin [Deferribacteraceae bacterium]|jgi:phage-related protein|nr:type II toxin-antitoxin system RelE/ParE family toxin [Deferribacteraceae bacterium]